MELLLLENEGNSHYVNIKDFKRFMYNKAKNNEKKYFCMNYSQCLNSEEILANHKKVCLEINGKQVAMYNLVTIINSCKHLL